MLFCVREITYTYIYETACYTGTDEKSTAKKQIFWHVEAHQVTEHHKYIAAHPKQFSQTSAWRTTYGTIILQKPQTLPYPKKKQIMRDSIELAVKWTKWNITAFVSLLL